MNAKKPNRASSLESAEPAIDFRRIRQLLREKAWFIAGCTLALVALAAVYLLLAHDVYASVATLVIEQQDRKVVNTMLDSQDVTQDDMHTLDVMKTVEQTLTSDTLALRVIKANHLAENPHFIAARPGIPYSDDELLLTFAKRVTVKLRRGTRLIDVTAESDSPLVAKQLAQSLVDEYLRDDAARATDTSKSVDAYLSGEAVRLKASLEKAERDLQTYREQNNAASLEDKQNIVIETLKDLNLKLNSARTDLMKLESDKTQFERLGAQDPKALLALPSIASSSAVLDAQRRVGDQQQLLAMVMRRYRAEHPKYIQAQSQLAQAQTDLDRAIVKAGEAIPLAYAAAADNVQKLERALHEQEQASFELSKIAVPYNSLLREVESSRALYQPIVNRLKQNSVAQALAASPVRLSEPARMTSQPVRPKKLLTLLASIFVGLAGSVGWCLLGDAANSSLRTVDEAERALNLPVTCAVPQLPGKRKTGKASPLVMIDEPASLTAESFRSLRTALELVNTGGQQIVLFTSAVPDEGKTFCAANCAAALAQQGYRTLLIDADLRRPAISMVFGCESGVPGFTNYLAGEIPLAEAIRGSRIEALSVLTAGTMARNPAELLSVARLAALFRDPALAAFERVVIDTAPINAVSDALSFVRHVSNVCLVIRAAKTPMKAAQRAHTALVAAGAKDIGIALNCLPEKAGAGYFYHYSSEYTSEGVYGTSKDGKATSTRG